MYVTIEEFQKYTGYVPEIDDTFHQIYIDSAENIVEDYLGYVLDEKTYTSYLDGNNTYSVVLNAKPVTVLTSVTIDNVIQDKTSFILNEEILTSIDSNITFTNGYRNIKVVYTAGWTKVPGLIKMTILRIAALLKSEEDGNIGITSKSFDASGARSFVQTNNFDKYLDKISKYRRISE